MHSGDYRRNSAPSRPPPSLSANGLPLIMGVLRGTALALRGAGAGQVLHWVRYPGAGATYLGSTSELPFAVLGLQVDFQDKTNDVHGLARDPRDRPAAN